MLKNPFEILLASSHFQTLFIFLSVFSIATYLTKFLFRVAMKTFSLNA
jgi:hypothetical protein